MQAAVTAVPAAAWAVALGLGQAPHCEDHGVPAVQLLQPLQLVVP